MSWKTRNCYDLKKPFLIRIKEMVIIIPTTSNDPEP